MTSSLKTTINMNEFNEYKNEIRKKLLIKIDDLRHKINSNEPMSECTQDVEFLIEINDKIDNCLSEWYH